MTHTHRVVLGLRDGSSFTVAVDTKKITGHDHDVTAEAQLRSDLRLALLKREGVFEYCDHDKTGGARVIAWDFIGWFALEALPKPEATKMHVSDGGLFWRSPAGKDPGDHRWFRCDKCEGLFIGPLPTVCSAEQAQAARTQHEAGCPG